MKKDSFKEFVMDQLCTLEGINARPMFGGFGIYDGDIFFGIIFKGRLYFKTDSRTKSVYTKMGMKPFRPNARQTLHSYYEVPVEIMEDQDELVSWAKKAVHARR
jgi:DNA transformation protein